jgi:hypothetical protein
VAGRWRYVCRAIDQFGQVIDVLVSSQRDAKAARRFFEQAMGTTKVTPVEVVTDKAATYSIALNELLPAAVLRRTVESALAAGIRVADEPVQQAGAPPDGHLQASRTSSVRILVAARQPTISRENTSMTNATSTVPDQLATSVKSLTHNWLGRVATNRRWTRSGARSAIGSAIVVRRVLSRTTRRCQGSAAAEPPGPARPPRLHAGAACGHRRPGSCRSTP